MSVLPRISCIARRFASSSVKNFVPMFDRILVEKFEAEKQTAGGIMIPEKAQGKVLEAAVVSVGPGARTNEGKTIPMSVKVGERVVLPEYGGTKLMLDDKEYYLYRETDITGKFQ